MSNQEEKFVSVIDCMDGRSKRAVELHLMHNHDGAFGDAVCKGPGVIQVLADRAHPEYASRIEEVKRNFTISYTKHGSRTLLMCGHAECAGFPVSDDVQIAAIQKAVDNVRDELGGEFPDVSYEGLFNHRAVPKIWVSKIVAPATLQQAVAAE